MEKYNIMIPNAENLTLDTILSDDIVWLWQLPQDGMNTILLIMWKSHVVAQNLSCFDVTPENLSILILIKTDFCFIFVFQTL